MALDRAVEGGDVPTAAPSRGALATLGALVGLTLGPSVIAVLSFGVFVRPIQMEFGWSRVQVSLAATIVSYMIMAVSPLQGYLTDRWGARRLALVSIPTFALGLAAFYVLPGNLLAFYGLWALLPVLAVGLWPLAYLKVVSTWFDRRLGLALGVANAGVGLGSAIVSFIANSLIERVGWRGAFVGLGLLTVAVVWPAAFFWVLENPGAARNGTPGAAAARGGIEFAAAVREPAFRGLAGAFFFLGLSTTALITQQAPMLIDAGWSPARAALVQSVFGVGLMLGRVGIGYTIDKVFAPYLMAIVAIGGAAGCLIYGLLPTTQLAFVASALVGLVVGAEFDVLALLIKRYFGERAFGKLYGAIFAVFQLACGIGIAGLAMSRSHFGTYAYGFVTFAVVLAVSALLFSRLPRYRYGAGQA